MPITASRSWRREGLDFAGDLASETAPPHGLVGALLEACGAGVKLLRDPARGGLSASLHERAEASGRAIVLDEAALPLAGPVRGACELRGLDPLYVANEGKLAAAVAPGCVEAALGAMRRPPLGSRAAAVGAVAAEGGRMSWCAGRRVH